MTLNEIIISQASASDDGDYTLFPQLEKNGKERIKISSTLSIVEYGNVYGFLKSGKCIGYVELKSAVKIADNNYRPISFIFIEPDFRKTYAVGAFLIGLRKVLKEPIILGSDRYGGILFSDGLKLVKSLKTSAFGDVKILDLSTGKIRELTDDDLSTTASKRLTLVFEEDDFPIKHEFSNKFIFVLENIENTFID